MPIYNDNIDKNRLISICLLTIIKYIAKMIDVKISIQTNW